MVSIGVFIFTFSITLNCGVAVESCTPLYGVRIQAYDNKKISQPVMWTMNNLTKGECLAECYKEKKCLTVHFSPLEPVCVALWARFDGVAVTTVAAPGYQLFQVNKPDLVSIPACEQDSDCSYINASFCHEERCRCDIGYGIDGTSCRILTECTTFSNTFTKYTGKAINYLDDITESGHTEESCAELCISNPPCGSFDFRPASDTCYVQEETWYDAKKK